MVQEQKAVEGSLEMRLGHEVPPEHYEILAAIVNNAWGWLFEATPEIIERRLKSGHPFVAAYGQKLPNEQIEGVDLGHYDGQKIPIVFLETVALRTDGRYENVPKNYFSLTNGGLWAPVPQNPDTVIMVDLTSIPSRTGVAQEIGSLIGYTKRLLAGQTDYQLPFDPNGINHIWTYSPDRPAVVKMHTDNGATDTRFVILNSRTPLNSSDGNLPRIAKLSQNTHLMSYRG